MWGSFFRFYLFVSLLISISFGWSWLPVKLRNRQHFVDEHNLLKRKCPPLMCDLNEEHPNGNRGKRFGGNGPLQDVENSIEAKLEAVRGVLAVFKRRRFAFILGLAGKWAQHHSYPLSLQSSLWDQKAKLKLKRNDSIVKTLAKVQQVWIYHFYTTEN